MEHAAEGAEGHGVGTLDGDGGEQYLVDQRLAGREAGEGRCQQMLVCGVVVAGGEGDPGVQQGAAGGGQIGG